MRDADHTGQSTETDPANARVCLQRRVIVAGGYALIVLVVLIACGYSAFAGTYFSADDLYLPTLYQDLTRWSGNLADWRLTPAAYYFPDMLLYLVARVTISSIEWSQYASGTVQLVLVVAAISSLIALLRAKASGPTLFVVPLMAIVVGFHCAGELPLLSPLFHLTQHGGAALITVVCVRLALGAKHVRFEWAMLGGLFTLNMLVGYSDPLFVPSCSAGLFTLGLCAAAPGLWRRLCGAGDPQRTAIRARSLASAIGGLIGAARTENIQTRIHNLLSEKSVAHTRISLSAVLRDLIGDAWSTTLWLGLGLLLCCLILMAFRSAEDRRLRALALWHSVSVVATIPAIASYGTYEGTGALRYFTVSYLSTLVVVLAVVARVLDRRPVTVAMDRAVALCAALALIGVVTAAMVFASRLSAAQYASHWRRRAACVQSILDREHTNTILTDYWQAKPLMLFSDGRVKALQMRGRLRAVYHWINSRNWYRGDHTFGVIGVNDLDPDAIRNRYGEPGRVEHCSDLEIFVYQGRSTARLSRDMSKLFARFTRH
jgi:hypothetical protein